MVKPFILMILFFLMQIPMEKTPVSIYKDRDEKFSWGGGGGVGME